MTPAAELSGVFQVYRAARGATAALQGLDLRVEAGETLLVLGPSGAGKSTVLRLLGGFEAPTAGRAVVLGREPGLLSRRRAADWRARRLGIVDQHADRALPPDLPARTVVGLTLALHGAPRQVWQARADELLERVGLREHAAARPVELSGGEQQRVALCAALAHRPELLLADEPAGELDAANAALVHELIEELARAAGTTVVVVSHDPATAAIADRVVHIRDGRLSTETRADGSVVGAAVIGRGGWARLPEDELAAAGIDRHAVVEPRPDGLLVRPAGTPAPPGPPRAARPVPRGRPTGPAVAELHGVTVTFGHGRTRRIVLSGLDATFEPGLLSVISGRSGSGKSTLLRLLAGLERPSAGRVTVLGTALEDLDRERLAALRRRSIGVVAQGVGLVPHLSAAENVALALEIRGRGRGAAARAALAWLEPLGIADRADARVDTLSAGERQRVAIARALAPEPALVVVDEPTSRLDEVNARHVAALLADAARTQGAAIVCATHEPLLIRVADRETVLGATAEAGAGPANTEARGASGPGAATVARHAP